MGPYATTEDQGSIFRSEQHAEHGRFCLWGTRGSIPVSGPQYARHGGNTACLEITHGADRIIFDAGSGIRELGLAIKAESPCKVHLFITHTHWDHIQGFPFFVPAHVPGFEIIVYAPPVIEQDIETIFSGQLDRAYFPVQMEDLKANLEFKTLDETPVAIGDVLIEWEHATHPGASVGYKVNIAGKTIAYVPDNEFMKGYLGPPKLPVEEKLDPMDTQFVEFIRGVDVLIHEAQYTAEEYVTHIGWGHSSLPNACVLAAEAEISRWITIHHDPSHSDVILQEKLNIARQVLGDLHSSVHIESGYDGLVGYL